MVDEEVNTEQPQGLMSSNPSLGCKLHKDLYGLKQAHRKWFGTLQIALLKLQFQTSRRDHSFFAYFSNGHTIYLLLYMDDNILTGSFKDFLKGIVYKLNLVFSLKYFGDLD